MKRVRIRGEKRAKRRCIFSPDPREPSSLLSFCSRFSFPVYTGCTHIDGEKQKKRGVEERRRERALLSADLLRLESSRGIFARTRRDCDGSPSSFAFVKRLYNAAVNSALNSTTSQSIQLEPRATTLYNFPA